MLHSGHSHNHVFHFKTIFTKKTYFELICLCKNAQRIQNEATRILHSSIKRSQRKGTLGAGRFCNANPSTYSRDNKIIIHRQRKEDPHSNDEIRKGEPGWNILGPVTE